MGNVEESKGKSVTASDSLTNTTENMIVDNMDSNVNWEQPAQLKTYRYNQGHKGPYIVYLDAYDKNDMRKYLNAVAVTKLFMELKIPDVLDISKVGYGRCKITFRNSAAANRCVEDQRLLERGLTPKILPHFVSKAGIVFDIPVEISEKEFLESIQTPYEVIGVQRITRRQKNNDGESIQLPTRSMKIIFGGNTIPKDIYFGYTRIEVKYFIPFNQCYRCFRYNHFAKHCKQTYELCRNCFNQHKDDVCLEIKCTNCKGNHAPTFKGCPAREKAYAIKKMMVIENLTIKEARTRYSSIFSNRFAPLVDNEEFPPLSSVRERNASLNNHSEATRKLHQVLPYAKVVKVNPNREREEANIRKLRMEHQKVLEDHEMVLSYDAARKSSNYNGPRPSQQQGTIDNSYDRVVGILSQVTKDTADLIANLPPGNSKIESIRRLLFSIRENVDRSMNIMDADRISKSIIEDRF